MPDKNRFGKGSIEFQIFNEFWGMFKEYCEITEDDTFWNKATNSTSAFSKKYKGTEYEKFTMNLSLALVELLDDKARLQNTKVAQKGDV